jgi:hypothetical protein
VGIDGIVHSPRNVIKSGLECALGSFVHDSELAGRGDGAAATLSLEDELGGVALVVETSTAPERSSSSIESGDSVLSKSSTGFGLCGVSDTESSG